MFKNSILYKLIIIFVVIAILPLGLVGYLISKNFTTAVFEITQKTEEMGRRNLQSAQDIGSSAIQNIVSQLDKKSTEAIEVRTTDIASSIADFLYERDQDILNLKSHAPSAQHYLDFIRTNTRAIILPSEPCSSARKIIEENSVGWRNPDNKSNWHHLPPTDYNKKVIPLYKEITFVSTDGIELIKVNNNKISDDLRDVSIKKNTYCRAEDYFKHALKLKKNELYVSKVIGEYVKGWLYRDGKLVKVRSESAYAGKENPQGKKFSGIIRWVIPVYVENVRMGYLTMALDHTHIMEFTDHVIPTNERTSALSDAGSGNYAFLWDFENQNISHPRDFFICGYDPLTGEEVPGWLSQDTYNEYKESKLSLSEFVENLPDFRNFTIRKKGAVEQLLAGQVGLDGRVLDHAPQCQGWCRGTEDGGSGSFLIFWSGLWKLTTYATVPYFTGHYGKSPRGFGYVTIGANVDDFHRDANLSKGAIEVGIKRLGHDIESVKSETQELIVKHSARYYNQLILMLIFTTILVSMIAVLLSLTFIKPLRSLMKGAKAIGSGDYDQNLEIKSDDEIGQLGHAFNRMAIDIAETHNALQAEVEERLKTEQALKSSEKRFRDIFEQAVEGIFQSTPKGELVSANPRMAEIFGYDSPESLLAEVSNIGEQLYVDSSRRDEYMEIMLQHGVVSSFEIEVYKREAQKAWISINARAVKEEAGDIEYIEGFIIDITKRKEADREKEELQNRLIRSKKMEALGLLAGGVAHDLNNVLSAVVGYPDLILMDLPEDSPLRGSILTIQDSGKKAAAIVQDLLTIARRGVVNAVVLNVNEIVSEYLKSPEHENLIHYHQNVSIRTELDSGLLNISGSAVHLKKSIMNLMNNAAEAMPNGGEIIVATQNRYIDMPIKGYAEILEGDFVLLTIRDNGFGIDSEGLKRIFEPFYTKKIMGRSGTGLGMSVVWGTVQDHNGYIQVESVVGEGTKFELYFPATRQDLATENVLTPIEDYSGNGESILVVDDILKQREVATALLTRLNYRVETVSSGEEAVEFLKNSSIDLLLLDMIMDPGIDGLDTYRQILKHHPRQKAIIASGFSDNDRVKEVQRLGAGEYIKKPYTLEKIGLAVKYELVN